MAQINITNETIATALRDNASGPAYYRLLRRFQKAFAEVAIRQTNGNRSKAALNAGINRATLRKFESYEV